MYCFKSNKTLNGTLKPIFEILNLNLNLMKKTSLVVVTLLSVILLSTNFQNAQAQDFVKGDKVVNFGLGIGTALYGFGYKMTIPPVSISGELGVKDDVGPGSVGVGGYLGIAGSKYSYNYLGDEYGWKYTYIVVGARGTYHLHDVLDKLDAYAGLMPYFAIVGNKEYGNWPGTTYYSAASSFIGVSLFIGGRYYVTDKFALMAELGYGVSYLNIGVALKL